MPRATAASDLSLTSVTVRALLNGFLESGSLETALGLLLNGTTVKTHFSTTLILLLRARPVTR
jgi:hypothetical protein